MAASSWRFYAACSEEWLASESDDHEGRSMWFGIFAREARELLSPDFDPGEGWEDRLALTEGDGVALRHHLTADLATQKDTSDG
jgi:hypothetical protein